MNNQISYIEFLDKTQNHKCPIETGIVSIFFGRDDRRYGFINMEDGESAFFHFNDHHRIINSSNGFSFDNTRSIAKRDPKEGDRLVFCKTNGSKGFKATPWSFAEDIQDVPNEKHRRVIIPVEIEPDSIPVGLAVSAIVIRVDESQIILDIDGKYKAYMSWDRDIDIPYEVEDHVEIEILSTNIDERGEVWHYCKRVFRPLEIGEKTKGVITCIDDNWVVFTLYTVQLGYLPKHLIPTTSHLAGFFQKPVEIEVGMVFKLVITEEVTNSPFKKYEAYKVRCDM